MATSAAQSGSRAPTTNGVLAITASQTSGNTVKQTASKLATPKLKVIVRRLPPGLTDTEFTSMLGEEWALDQGKVDWFLYKPGKDSKDPSKPSRPSRAYLHLTNETHLLALSEAVRQATFEDVQNTFNNPALIGPPTVEFAPYGRTPGGRRRSDARAGTIDQDSEFMAFLEGLANPTTLKEINADILLDGTPNKPEKVTTTPLVQYLKDKKANKSKEAALKAAKKQESQLSKNKSSSSNEEAKKKGKDVKADKLVEKAAKEAVKILNREAASKVAPGSSTTVSEPSGSENTAPPKLDVTKIPGRQRSAVVAAHIRMLQRDLGLSPAQAHRQVRRDTADAQKAEKAAATEKAAELKEASPSVSSPSSVIPTAPKAISTPAGSRRARGKGAISIESDGSKATASSSSTPVAAAPPTPIILLKKPETPQTAPATPITPTTKSAPSAASRKVQPIAVPSEGAMQAFVKHANPSQGVTEPLLKEAMEKFGAVSMCEIDKRKGFAYVDFVEPDGLKKAMAANPITVAQGTVQVMQRKGTSLPPEKKAPHPVPHGPPARGGRGGGRGGTIGRRGGRGGARGGAQASSDTPKAPTIAPTGPAK